MMNYGKGPYLTGKTKYFMKKIQYFQKLIDINPMSKFVKKTLQVQKYLFFVFFTYFLIVFVDIKLQNV